MSKDKKSRSTRTDTIDREKATIRSLRNSLKAKNKEITRLKSELKTLEAAFSKAREFLRDSTERFTLQELIEAAKQNESLADLKDQLGCPECGYDEIIRLNCKTFEIYSCKSCGYKKKIIF